MNLIQKETEQTLKAGDRINSASASDALLERLKQIPNTLQNGYEKVPVKVVWAVAASVAFLIALNVYSTTNYKSESTIETTQSSDSYFDHLKTL